MIESQIMASTSAARARNTQTGNTARSLHQLMSNMQSTADNLYPTTQEAMAAVSTTVKARLTSTSSSAASPINRVQSEMGRSSSQTVDAAVSSINAQIGSMGGIGMKMSSTHYMNPRIPVYRWMMFHTYSNNGVGWFDGNNVRYFGGRNPSNWGDGNARVMDMHQDFAQLGKMLTRRGVGTVRGA